MRTLKKTLSLVLVVAMVLGLCVVGASATNKVDGYEDAGKIGAAYTEAVGVMTGLGIVDGVTDTELRPENTYQRDQAAKIIAYMLLGKDKAEKLSCTKAPFEDVPANHWAAGYIAFCKDVGIIDGVTETEFKPTAALTGFQWAKMLLSAVGFGVNGELEGDHWSVKTQIFGNAVNLFDGDTAAATHNALQRQQAMLLAFNVLTDVNVVVWSEALGDYIEGYYTFADRYTYQGTLGENVWKLKSVTGVIVNNEGMGNATTNVNVKGEYTDYAPNTVSVVANTGLDMMYHAARVWYVEGTKTNTGVYVYDLAKTETTKCPAKATDGALKIGDTTKSLYEAVAVDNTAIDAGKKTVEFYASWEVVGAISTVNKTTVLGGYGAVKNEYITSDADVESNDWVIVLKAGEKAYYTYALSATSGAVQSVDKKGNITLTDGTVLAPSNIVISGRATNYTELVNVLVGAAHVTPTYYFYLDTHGHYMYLTKTPFQTVAYFTGVTKLSSAHDAWSNSVQFAAQFVDVQTGEIETIPVRNDWVDDFTKYTITQTRTGQGYFDITDELYGDPSYYPHPVLGTGGTAATYSDKFVNIDGYTFSAADSTCILGTLNGRNIRFNPSTVTFIIANGAGDSLTVDTYTGVSGLIAGYAAKHNQKVTSVSLSKMAVTYSVTDAGNPDAVVIFAYDSTIANGQYVFFPYDVTSWDIIADNYYGYDVAYLDGKEAASDMVFTRAYYNANLTGGIARGFYTYTINELGFYTITRVVNANQSFIYQKSDIDEASGIYWINGHRVADDVVIADTRANVPDELKVRNVADLYDLIYETNWANPDVQIAYMIEGTSVGVIYVVDWNLGQATFSFGDALDGWTVNGHFTSGVVYEDETLKITGTGVSALKDGTYVDFGYTFNGTAAPKTVEGVVKSDAAGNKWIEVNAHNFAGWGNKTCTFVITSATYDVDVVMGDAVKNFTLWANVNSATDTTPTSLTVPVGGKVQLGFVRASAAAASKDIAAVVNVTNGTGTNFNINFNTTGNSVTQEFVPVTNTLTVNSISASLKIDLGNKDNDVPKNFNFANADSDANEDTYTVTNWVPGDAVDFTLVTNRATAANYILALSTDTNGVIKSINASQVVSDPQPFNFTIIPKGNVVNVSSSNEWGETTHTIWVAETEPAV